MTTIVRSTHTHRPERKVYRFQIVAFRGHAADVLPVIYSETALPEAWYQVCQDASVTSATLSQKGEFVDYYTRTADEYFDGKLNSQGESIWKMFCAHPLVAFTVDQFAYSLGCRRGMVLRQLMHLLRGHVVERIGNEIYRVRLPEGGVDDLSDEAKELRTWYERDAQPVLLLTQHRV